MRLSNKLTFYLVFSVLLIAVFAFIVPQAMAQVTITAVSSTDEGANKANKRIITFTYSENPSPAPVLADFTLPDNTNTPNDADAYRDPLPATPAAAVNVDGKTVKLTFTAASNSAETPAIPDNLQLRGYSHNLSAVSTDAENPTTLNLAASHIPGKGYIVYVRTTTGESPLPHLPTNIIGDANRYTVGTTNVERVQAITAGNDGNSNIAMPDLEDFFFVGGGTINLKIPAVATGESARPATAADSRQLVINEVMWALDNRLVGQAGDTKQQWIEVWNPKTTPAPNPTFEFINNPAGLNPPAAIAAGTADRLSNIPSRTVAWNVKGQSGTSTLSTDATPVIIGANPAFKSMYRSDIRPGGEGSGSSASNWEVSGRVYRSGFYGSPGSVNVRGVIPTVRTNPDAYTPPKDKVIINEVFNSATAGQDWLELRNVSTGEVNIKDWWLNRTDGTNRNEHGVQKFPEIKIPAGEVLLIVAKGPADTMLAPGQNIQVADAQNQARGAGPHKYRIIPNFNIPNMTAGYLILRSHGDTKFRTGRQHLHDVAGPSRVSHNTLSDVADNKEKETGYYWNTDAWPINGHTGNNYRAHNAKDASNGNASLDPAANFKEGSVWARSGTNHGWRKGGGSHAGYSGGIGYDRNHKGAGTPGYHNDIVKGKATDLTSGALAISELMLTTDSGRYPQYIELHNTSSVGINLAADGSDADAAGSKKKDDGWRMIIENYNSGTWKSRARPLVIDIKLKDLFSASSGYIAPNQTVLIVADKARNSKAAYFPAHRVASIWGHDGKGKFGMQNRRDDFLNAAGGFYIMIIDGAGNVADEVGNLDGKASNRGQALDTPVWDWPTAMTASNERSSLIRLKDDNYTLRSSDGYTGSGTGYRKGVPDRDAQGMVAEGDMTGAAIPMGVKWRGDNTTAGTTGKAGKVWTKYAKYAWIHAVDSKRAYIQDTWYGSDKDFGTPGHTSGTPLPVSLSFFRPALEDGTVVIRWTTESELDNAGFNILRSETRNGEFKQVNPEMINGQGTTGERHSYKWVDPTAKPGVVYYYQIEDVSFAGERQTLTMTKLKGLISAAGKATTTWGEIKSLTR